MLLPDIKIDVDPKYLAIAAFVLCVLGMAFLTGYQLGRQPVEVVCKDFVQKIQVQETQIKELESDLSSSKDFYTTQCVNREKQICTDLVRKTVENIKKLRCKICSMPGAK